MQWSGQLVGSSPGNHKAHNTQHPAADNLPKAQKTTHKLVEKSKASLYLRFIKRETGRKNIIETDR